MADSVLLVLFCGLAAVVYQLPFHAKYLGDPAFHPQAKTLAQALWGAVPWTEVRITQAPGPVFFFAIPYSIVPPTAEDWPYWRAGVAWALLWMAIALLLVRRSAERLAGLADVRPRRTRTIGIGAALVSLASPFMLYYSFGINAEPMAYLGTVLLLYGWLRTRRRAGDGSDGPSGSEPKLAAGGAARERGGVILAVAGLSILLLARPNAVLVAALGLAVAIVTWVAGRERDARLAATVAGFPILVLVGAMLLSSAVTERRRDGVAQNDYLAHVAFHGSFQYRTEPWDWRYWDDKARVGSADYALFEQVEERLRREADASGTSLGELKRDWVVRDVLTHPLLRARMVGIRFLTLHINKVNSVGEESFAIGPLPGTLVSRLFHLGLNSFTALLVAGSLALLLMMRGRLVSLWVLWAPWVGLLLFHGLVYAEPRYLFPAQACWAVMSVTSVGVALESLAGAEDRSFLRLRGLWRNRRPGARRNQDPESMGGGSLASR